MDRFEESERFMSSLSSNRSLLDHFSALRDPREGWRVLYPLPEILLLVLCATLSGMEDFVEIRLWGEQRIDFLRRLLPFDRGLPAMGTVRNLVCGAIMTPMEGAYGNQERHPGRFTCGA